MKLGFSTVSINPDFPVELSGYGYYQSRLTEQVQDCIYARALYLESETSRFLLINVDLLGLSPYVVYTVKQELNKQLGLQPEQILLLSIHTHTAPSAVQTIGCGEVNWDYIGFLIERMILAGKKAAHEEYQILRIRKGKKAIEPIGYNRANADGPIDATVYTVSFELEGQRPYLLVNYACHPVTLGPICQISPDYPGEVVAALDTRDCHGMFVNGFCGDIDPVSNLNRWGGGSKETIQKYGEQIAEAAISVLVNDNEEQPSLHTLEYTFSLPLQRLGFGEVDRLAEIVIGRDAENTLFQRAALEWTRRAKEGIMGLSNGYQQAVTVQIAKIGDIILAGVQGELFTQIGLDIRSGGDESMLMLCGNANAALRYVSTDDEITAMTYGGFTSNIVYGALPLPEGTARFLAEQVREGIRLLQSGVTGVRLAPLNE